MTDERDPIEARPPPKRGESDPAQDEPELDPGYFPDPDDDPDARDQVAAEDAAALTRSAIIVSTVAILFFGLLALAGVPGMQAFSRGFAIGCLMATLNLRMLANAAWRIFNQRVVSSLFAFFASFASLIGVAVWLGKVHPEWILGYGIGLTIPGAAGLLYAVRVVRQER